MNTEIATTAHQPPADKPKVERKLTVTGKVKRAIDAMVFDGLIRKAAAEHAGLKEHSLYVAFTKPHVKVYYNQQLEVLRTSARARNFHRLEEIREQDSNLTAAVHAIKTLEGDNTSKNNVNVSVTNVMPGIVIDLTDDKSAGQQMDDQMIIEVNPLSDKAPVGNSG